MGYLLLNDITSKSRNPRRSGIGLPHPFANLCQICQIYLEAHLGMKPSQVTQAERNAFSAIFNGCDRNSTDSCGVEAAGCMAGLQHGWVLRIKKYGKPRTLA